MSLEKQIFVNLIENLISTSDDIDLIEELKANTFYLSLYKSLKRKPMTAKKSEVEKLKDAEYTTCEYCDKRIKLSYIDKHTEDSLTCYRQRQTKRNVFNCKEMIKDKYAVSQALNLTLKYKHVDFKELVLPEQTLKILRCRTKHDIFRV